METTKTISKRLLAIMMSLAMVFSLVQGNIFSANAENIGDYVYEILKDGTVEIICYMGTAKEITIPSTLDGKTVTSIGTYAFSGCDSLTSINVADDNANFISDNGVLFNKDKTTLIKYPSSKSGTSYTIPNTVKIIGKVAFDECKSLESVTIGNSVKSIGDCAFRECNSLTSIVIPDSVESIGDYAFAYSKNLKSVQLGKGIKSIGKEAFAWCESLKSPSMLPDGITRIGAMAFHNTPVLNDNAQKIDGILYWGNYLISVEDKLNKYQIKKGTKVISDEAFMGCESPESITIPDGVKSIGEYAFYGLDSLESVTIPNSVTKMGKYAFTYCYNLKSVKLSSKLEEIPESAFTDCRSLKSIKIPKSVKTIGKHAFERCYDLKTVTFADGITSIGNSSFKYCKSLKSVKLPNTLKSIGNLAFALCTSLKKIEIPSSVNSIKDKAFKLCKSLESVKIAAGIKTISAEMFRACKSLKSVTIPKSVTEIELSAFWGCKALKKINYNGKFSGLKKIAVEYANKEFRKTPIYYVSNKTTKKHTHTTKIKNKKSATYFKEGYSGDAFCKTCGMLAEGGIIINHKAPGKKIKITGGKNQIKIKYTKVSGATGFRVKVYNNDIDCEDSLTYNQHFNTRKSVTKTIKNLEKGNYGIYVYLYKKSGGKTVFSGESYYSIKVK